MKEYRFLVPVDKSNGIALDLADCFGGYTSPNVEHIGAWLNDGDIITDRTVEFRVATSDPDAFFGWCADLCGRIGEACVYVVCGENAYFVYPDGIRGLPQ